MSSVLPIPEQKNLKGAVGSFTPCDVVQSCVSDKEHGGAWDCKLRVAGSAQTAPPLCPRVSCRRRGLITAVGTSRKAAALCPKAQVRKQCLHRAQEEGGREHGF